MFHLTPRPLARLALRLAHAARHRWRVIWKIRLRGVSVMARDAGGRILMVRHTYASRAWALPGGGLSVHEDPAAGAQRELREELGITLTGLEVLGIIEEQISGSPHTAYVITGMAQGEPVPDGREIATFAWFEVCSLPTDITELTKRRLALLAEFQNRSS